MKHETPKAARATSPEREALRQAIARRTDLQAQIAKLDRVLIEETEKKYAAAHLVDDAAAALAQARETQTHDNVARVLGEEPQSPLTVLEAQRAVERAESDWKALHDLCEGISERIESERASEKYCDSAIGEAIKAVVSASPGGRRVVDDYCEKLTAFSVAEKTLHFVLNSLTPDLQALATRHHTDTRDSFRKLQPDKAWVAALAALATDADAVLP